MPEFRALCPDGSVFHKSDIVISDSELWRQMALVVEQQSPFHELTPLADARNTLGAGSVPLVLWEYRDFGDRIEGEQLPVGWF